MWQVASHVAVWLLPYVVFRSGVRTLRAVRDGHKGLLSLALLLAGAAFRGRPGPSRAARGPGGVAVAAPSLRQVPQFVLVQFGRVESHAGEVACQFQGEGAVQAGPEVQGAAQGRRGGGVVARPLPVFG